MIGQSVFPVPGRLARGVQLVLLASLVLASCDFPDYVPVTEDGPLIVLPADSGSLLFSYAGRQGSVVDVAVQTEGLRAERAGDVRISLESPDGTTVELWQNDGGNLDFSDTYSFVEFSADGVAPTAVGPGVGASDDKIFPGFFVVSDLGEFRRNAESPNGTWRLRFRNDSTGTNLEVESATLTLGIR